MYMPDSRLNLLRISIEMTVILDGLPADITHTGPTRTRHLVTPLHLVETFLTLPASSQHGLRHLRLDVGTHVFLTLFLHLVASQGNMINFSA